MSEFDLNKLKSAYETGDIDTVASLFSEKYTMSEMDDVTPPSNPRQRNKTEIIEMVGRAAGNGVKFVLENTVDGGSQVAYTIHCLIPNGRKITTNSIAEVKGGQIISELHVSARDPEKK